MPYTGKDYASLSDEEWIALLLTQPPIEEGHRYFFYVRCAPLLEFIASSLFQEKRIEPLIGEFYEFISRNDWHLLRLFKGERGASLASYLSRCSVRYFVQLHQKERDRAEAEKESFHIYENITDWLNDFSSDKQESNLPVWEAFRRLEEREQKILRYLIIEGRSTLEIAEEMWPFVHSTERDWRRLPTKSVQDTLSAIKRRALVSLCREYKKLR